MGNRKTKKRAVSRRRKSYKKRSRQRSLSRDRNPSKKRRRNRPLSRSRNPSKKKRRNRSLLKRRKIHAKSKKAKELAKTDSIISLYPDDSDDSIISLYPDDSDDSDDLIISLDTSGEEAREAVKNRATTLLEKSRVAKAEAETNRKKQIKKAQEKDRNEILSRPLYKGKFEENREAIKAQRERRGKPPDVPTESLLPSISTEPLLPS